MIDLVNLSLQFTGDYLFQNVNLKISKGDRIALAGSNGTGKSSLLKIIAGTEQPESGKVIKQRGIKIGYLPQELIQLANKSVFEEVKYSLKEITELEEREKELTFSLSGDNITDEEKNKLVYKLGELHHRKEDIDYFGLDSRIEKVLQGLGFSTDDFIKHVATFSGGWQMRIQLAEILLAGNDLILLDEPTNHLDLDSLQWLIDFLTEFKGSLVIVSHDKYFINHTTKKTLEIFNNNLTFYNGNYEAYLKFKEERTEQIGQLYKNQQRKLQETERFIERFRYKASKAKQVQSRVKQLEKIERVQVPDLEAKIEVKFPAPSRSGVIPIDLKDISKSFDSLQVLQKINITLDRGDKIAFVGRNGAGKTTLAKIIAGKLQPDGGKVITGYNTVISYYAQEVADNLPLDKDILDAVAGVSEEYTPLQLRTVLGSFLFSGEDVFKKIKVLSGGEKSRVALSKILLTKANLLVLDEPTNHLDYSSKLILQEALVKFPGTLIIVSHDIDFIKPIVNKVVEFKYKQIKMFYGGIDYYLIKREEIVNQGKSNDITTLSNNKEVTRREQKKIDAEKRQKKYEATFNIKTEIENYEKEIELLEEQKLKLEQVLGTTEAYINPLKSKEITLNYEKTKRDLEKVYSKWAELHENLEHIENSFEN